MLHTCRLAHLLVCVCVLVGRSVRKVYSGKTAEWIWMPFGVVSGVGQGMGVLDGGCYRWREGAVLRVNLGRPIVANGPMGTLLRSCAELCEPIELLFGMVSGVTQGIHVLDGGLCASRGRGSFALLAQWFQWNIL